MAKKRYRPEEILIKIRLIEFLHRQGIVALVAIRQISVKEVKYNLRAKEYCGMDIYQLKRLKEVEKENQRLTKVVSDLTLEKLILKEVKSEKYLALHIAV